MDNPDYEFQRVYQENIGVQIDEAIESSPLSQAVIEFMSEEIVIAIKIEHRKEIKKTKRGMDRNSHKITNETSEYCNR